MTRLWFSNKEYQEKKNIIIIDNQEFEVSNVKVDGKKLYFTGITEEATYQFIVDMYMDTVLEDIEGLTAGEAFRYPWWEAQFIKEA